MYVVRSRPPEATRRLSGENATVITHIVCLLKICPEVPVVASHNRTLLSSPPDAIHFPLGETATALTPPACPFRTTGGWFAVRLHSRTVPSAPQVTSREPSGVKATPCTFPSWPTSRVSSACLWRFQRTSVPRPHRPRGSRRQGKRRPLGRCRQTPPAGVPARGTCLGTVNLATGSFPVGSHHAYFACGISSDQPTAGTRQSTTRSPGVGSGRARCHRQAVDQDLAVLGTTGERKTVWRERSRDDPRARMSWSVHGHRRTTPSGRCRFHRSRSGRLSVRTRPRGRVVGARGGRSRYRPSDPTTARRPFPRWRQRRPRHATASPRTAPSWPVQTRMRFSPLKSHKRTV